MRALFCTIPGRNVATRQDSVCIYASIRSRAGYNTVAAAENRTYAEQTGIVLYIIDIPTPILSH